MPVIHRVREVMEDRNISQSKLSKASDVHRNTIQKMLLNNSEPSTKVIVGLKKLVPELSLNWILLEEGAKYIDAKDVNSLDENREMEIVKGRLAQIEKELAQVKQEIKK